VRVVHQRSGTAVDQREPVVVEHGFELTGSDEIAHEPNGAACDAKVRQHALITQLGESLDRTASRHRRGEGEVILRVMQVHQLDSVKPEPLQALLDRAFHPLAGEVAGVRIGVHLGGEHESGRQAARSRQRAADAPLGRAAAVAVGRVHEIERAAEHLPDRRFRTVPGYFVAVERGHARERAGADADGRYLQSRPAKRPAIGGPDHHALASYLMP
jgi:hypothetical protein